MKKALFLLLALFLLTVSVGAVDLFIDTLRIDTDTPPTIVDGRTLVPVRAIFESLGATVNWDASTKTATGLRGGTTVVVQIDNKTAYVNGRAQTLDVPAKIINGRTMVPARFISEALDCDVTWHKDTKTAAVAKELKGQHIYVTPTGEHYHYDGSCNGGTYYEASLAEAMGRGLTPCDKCVLKGSTVTGGGSGDASNFDTYSIPEQQQTSARYVLNTNTMKIHYPRCDSVEKIKPENYATSNLEVSELVAQGYKPCGVCKP